MIHTIVAALVVAVAAIAGILFLHRKLDRAETIAAEEMTARWADAAMFTDIGSDPLIFDPQTGVVLDEPDAECPTFAVLPPGYTMVDMKGFVAVNRDPKTGRYVKKAAA